MTYAVLRYHVSFFGVHGSDQLPLFIFNKAVSAASLMMIALAVGARALQRVFGGPFNAIARDRRPIGLAGFGLAGAHTAMSVLMLTPAYYGKLYTPAGKMSFAGELSMLAGVAALVLLVWQARLPKSGLGDPRRALRGLGLGVLALSALHVAAMGWGGWFEVSAWPGGMPPITLWSFVIALVGVGLGLMPGRSSI